MSLVKAIQHGKEHRKFYRGGKSVDPGCRNHGDCSWCNDNRMYRSNRLTEKTDYDLKIYDKEEYNDEGEKDGQHKENRSTGSTGRSNSDRQTDG